MIPRLDMPPPEGVLVDHHSRVFLFGDKTHQGQQFHRIAHLCRRIAEEAGAGAESMANVLVQAAAYHLGAEYDDPSRRQMLATEMVRVLAAKAERAVHEVSSTGFRLATGALDVEAGSYVDSSGRLRIAAGSPIGEVFIAVALWTRDYARQHQISPAMLVSDLMATAGYHVGSTCPDANRRHCWLDLLAEAFLAKLAESPALARQNRAMPPFVAPCHGGAAAPTSQKRIPAASTPWPHGSKEQRNLTMRVQIETPTHWFIGRVVAGIDLDGTFIVVDDSDGARLRVNGWICDVTVIPACAAIMPDSIAATRRPD